MKLLAFSLTHLTDTNPKIKRDTMEYAGEFLNFCYEKTICVLGLQGFMQSLEDISPDVQRMLLGKIQSFHVAQV